jgi:hypothetical protein
MPFAGGTKASRAPPGRGPLPFPDPVVSPHGGCTTGYPLVSLRDDRAGTKARNAHQWHSHLPQLDCGFDLGEDGTMIKESLKEEVASLAKGDRRELMGYMVALQITEDPAFRRTLTERIDDKSPENWVTLEELDAKLKAVEDEGL